MTNVDDSQNSDFGKTFRDNTGSESEARNLTQEIIDEQVENNVVLLMKGVDDLNPLIQVSSSVHQPNLPLRASTRANSSTTSISSDTHDSNWNRNGYHAVWDVYQKRSSSRLFPTFRINRYKDSVSSWRCIH